MKIFVTTIVLIGLLGCAQDLPVAYECGGFGVLIASKDLKVAHKEFKFVDTSGVYRIYKNSEEEDQFAQFDTALIQLRIFSKGTKRDTGFYNCIKK
jgi:hypothetical protein